MKRGGQVLAGLLNDFSAVDKALNTMENAAGSADREMGIIRDSIDYKLNSLKQTWVGVFQEIISRDSLGGILDFLTAISDGLGGIISNLGILQTAAIAMGTVWGTKNLSLVSYDSINGGFSFGKSQETKTDNAFYGELKQYISNKGTKGDFKDFTALSTTFKDASINAKQLAENTIESVKAGQDLDVAMKNVDATIKSSGGGIKNLGISLKNLGGSLLAGIASAGISMVASFAVTELVKGGTKFVSWLHDEVLTNAGEIRRQFEAVDDLANQVSESTKEIEGLENIISEYDELSKKMNDTSLSASELISVKENMLSLQDTLVDSYGIEAESIDLVNGNYNEQLQLLKEIKKQKAQDFLYNPENGAFVSGKDNKSDFQRNLDIINSIIDSGEAEYSSGTYHNRSAKTIEETFGFDPTEVVKQFQELSISVDKTANGFIKSFTLTMDPNTTKEKANEILTDFYAELVRQYPNNSAVSEWYESIQESFGLDDYDFERAQTARPNVEYAIKQALVDASEDGTTVLDELDTAISNYNKALTEFEVNATEINQANLNRATTALEEVRQKAAEIPKEVGYILGSNGVDYYQQMVSDAFDKVQLTTEEKIEHFFDDVTDKTSGNFEEFKKEYQKIFDWGLDNYINDIFNPTSTKFGNIDMDNRQLIQYDEEYLAKHKEALESWFNYDEDGNIIGTYYDYLVEVVKNGEEAIDTVFGGSDSFRWNNQEHEIAFSPILQTENGPVFLSEQNCKDYISSVIDKAAEDGIISADEIIKIDAEGTGFKVGDEFVKGLIAGVDTTGNQKGIHASIVGALMHFTGDYGAINIAAKGAPESSQIKGYTYKKRSELYAQSTEAGKIFDQSLLSKNAEVLTLQDIDGLIKEAKEKASQANIELEIKPRTTNLVDALAANKSALASLEKLYDTSNTEEGGTAQFIENFADPENLNSIETAFESLIQTMEDAGDKEGAQKLSLALSEFEEAAVKANGDTEKMQTAVNKLVTAQIQQSKTLEEVTEDTKDYAIAQLQAQGVTNAEKLVMERLSKSTKKLMSDLKALAGVLNEDVIEALQSGDQNSEAYTSGMQSIQKQLGSMFQTQNANGEMVDFQFDPTWIINNLELIKNAAAGSEEAIYNLQKAATKEIVLHTDIDVPENRIQDVQAQINDLIDKFDISDIEIGASLDDTGLIQGLNGLVNAGAITRDTMNSILTGIGVKPNIEYEDAKIEAALESYADAPGYAKDAIKASMKASGTFKVPKINYVLDSKASTANYAAPVGSTKTSGGGGGGGGGGGNGSDPTQPKAETEETFDWIAVAIQRLEEEETRLGKIVDNVYDHWEDRNEALGKQIDTLRKDVQAEYLAYLEYARNAEELQVKPLNDADYGENDQLVKAEDQRLYEEAVAKVATGEYQRKIREGQLTGDDIESISNHFLTDWIKEYQTRLNNAIQSADKVKDKEIELGDAAKKRFDLVKSEFDGLVGILEAKAGLIEERISRAEAHSYFVNEKYYRQLIANNEKQYADRLEEYNKLVEKRDQALAEGSITKDSEAWVEMEQDIINCRKELEALTTSTVNYRKELDQIQWDKFDRTEEQIARIRDEMETLISLMANQELFEENGDFTNEGLSTAGLYIMQYNSLAEQMLSYRKQYEDALAKLEEDPANQERQNRVHTLADTLQDYAKEMEGLEQNIKDLLQQSVDKKLEFLDELISKYEEALDSEKELYDYQKNIRKQVENISHLERMLNVYQGDDSEEARKIRQVTGNQLEEAKQQLEETEWDKMISETKKALTDMRDSYEEALNEAIKDARKDIQYVGEEVNKGSADICDTVRRYATDYMLPLTKTLNTMLEEGSRRNREDVYGVAANIARYGNDSSWGNGSKKQNENLNSHGFDVEDVRDVIKDIQKVRRGETTSIQEAIAYDIFTKSAGGYWGKTRDEQLKNLSKAGFDADKINSIINEMNRKHTKDGDTYSDLANAYGLDKKAIDSGAYRKKWFGMTWEEIGKKYGFDGTALKEAYGKDDFAGGYTSGQDIGLSLVTTMKEAADGIGSVVDVQDKQREELEEINKTANKILEAENAKIDADIQYQKDMDSADAAKAQANADAAKVRGYAKGSSRIPYDQVAVTQEDGSELIFRASDGSMLTPLGANDMVFTNEMSQRLWEIAKNGVPTGISNSVPQVASNVGNTINQENAIAITLPNVTNYEQFKNALRKDTQFTNFVQEVTIGQLAGNNTLKKNKY